MTLPVWRAIMEKRLTQVPAARPPDCQDEVFPGNALSQVVCELRFPIVIDLVDGLPREFQKEVRSHFPHYNRSWVLEFEPGAVDATREPRYEFLSRDKDWKVSLKPTAISLETSNYTSFNDFEKRLVAVVTAAASRLPLLFFTRIGLRYINSFPLLSESNSPDYWVNANLLAPLQLAELSGANRFWQEISGIHEAGGSYFLRHGFGVIDNLGYILDIDVSMEGVETDAAVSQVKHFKAIAKRIFLDSVSENALKWLRQFNRG